MLHQGTKQNLVAAPARMSKAKQPMTKQSTQNGVQRSQSMDGEQKTMPALAEAGTAAFRNAGPEFVRLQEILEAKGICIVM
jgi:hypothetical protein